jgi:hypothetical protein
LDISNIHEIIIKRLNKAYTKDEFETTEEYNKRISQFRRTADSIISKSICEYIDVKSNIKLKFLNYNADNQTYNIDVILGNSTFNSNHQYIDGEEYKINTKWNTSLKIKPQYAKKIQLDNIIESSLVSDYESWSDKNGHFSPNNFKIKIKKHLTPEFTEKGKGNL